MTRSELFGKIVLLRTKYISHRKLILLLSLIIGILSGIAAVLLKNIVFYTHHFLTEGLEIHRGNILLFAFPIIGLTLTVLFIKYIVKDDLGHGVSRILYAISRKNSLLKPHNTYSSLISSTITIGFGGSLGLEAPIVLTGAGIGSNLGRMFHLNYKSLTLLIGCGCAGAIAGIFKAPIAGLVFTLEVIMLDLTMASIIPLLISAVSGAAIAYFFMGSGVHLHFVIKEVFTLRMIPYYILLGIFTGMISLYFTKANFFIESSFQKIKKTYHKLLLGGLILSVLIFVFPSLYGEGYWALQEIFSGQGADLVNNSFFYPIKDNYSFFMVFLLLLLVFKVIAMSVTSAGGGVGGIFAPSLFMGGVSGYFLARIINATNTFHVPETNFAVVGMAGLMAGVMHAPLTGIFLIAEITGGYTLFLPLIITATISYLTIMYFEPHSIYTKRLAARGELITHHKDKAVLSQMKVNRLIETNFNTVNVDASLGELVKVISKSKRNVFPVVDEENNFLGVVFINDIRDIIFKTEMYKTTFVRDLMFMPDFSVDPDDSMEDVARKFQGSDNYNLPVLKDGKYIGFVSKANVFSTYRLKLKEFSDE